MLLLIWWSNSIHFWICQAIRYAKTWKHVKNDYIVVTTLFITTAHGLQKKSKSNCNASTWRQMTGLHRTWCSWKWCHLGEFIHVQRLKIVTWLNLWWRLYWSYRLATAYWQRNAKTYLNWKTLFDKDSEHKSWWFKTRRTTVPELQSHMNIWTRNTKQIHWTFMNKSFKDLQDACCIIWMMCDCHKGWWIKKSDASRHQAVQSSVHWYV